MPTSNRHRWFSKESDRASMEAFDYSPLAGRVVFGCGTIARVAAEVEALGCRRAFVLSDPHHAAAAALRVRDFLGNRAVGLSTEAAMHTPVEVTEKVLRDVLRTQADCLISLGGGSTTGLGKALALRTDLPQVVIPTTYAGSEATPFSVRPNKAARQLSAPRRCCQKRSSTMLTSRSACLRISLSSPD